MSDSNKVKTNREKYAERLKGKYPDREYADDEAMWAQANEDYDGYDKEISEYKDREKALSDMFANDPRSAAFMTNWRKGGDPAVELVRMYGQDFLEEMQDPEKLEAFAEANKEYAERVAKEKDLEKEYEENMSGVTLPTLERMRDDEGYSDDEIDEAMEFLAGVMMDGLRGKFTEESILMAMNAIHHDEDVSVAAREGEVKGRNAKIEERLRRRGRGDGTADLAGKNGGGRPRNAPEMGALDRYGEGNTTIWERGGEKRRPAKGYE